MTLAAPTQDERHVLLKSALKPLDDTESTKLFDILDELFHAALTDDGLLHDDVDNPIDHHTTVLEEMMHVAKGEAYSFAEIQVAATIAILHDIHPVPKVTRGMRNAAKTPEEKAKLELENLRNRIIHMGVGATRARQLLSALNAKRKSPVFTDKDIDAICSVIAIHDVPSIDIPIPKDAKIAVAFREADRLWMQTRAGLKADWARKPNKVENPTHEQLVEQSNNNLESYRTETALYDPKLESFDPKTFFFRTDTGRQRFRVLNAQW